MLGVVQSDGHVEVTLEGPRDPLRVQLRESCSEPTFTMCQAHKPGPVKLWELVEIRGGELRARQSAPRGGHIEKDVCTIRLW